MDVPRQIATVSALEAATDALLIALGKRPEPDFAAATAALEARGAALRFLLEIDPGSRPPELSARLRRVLERDAATLASLRAEMDALRDRLVDRRRFTRGYGLGAVPSRDTPDRETRGNSGQTPDVRGRRGLKLELVMTDAPTGGFGMRNGRSRGTR